MGRDDTGYDTANLDTAWAHGPKARRLQRLIPDLWPLAWTAYMSVVTETWRRGKRATLEEAWLMAFTFSYTDTLKALQTVGLLDRTGRLPQAVFTERIQPSLDRINAKRRRIPPGTPPVAKGETRPMPPMPSAGPSGDGPRGGPMKSAKELIREAGFDPDSLK